MNKKMYSILIFMRKYLSFNNPMQMSRVKYFQTYFNNEVQLANMTTKFKFTRY